MFFGKKTPTVYGDDFFADTRMSFGEHIEDLRSHLVRALKWFCFGMILGFVVAKPMLDYITAPVEAAIQQYYENRRLTVGEGTEDPSNPLNQQSDKVVLKVEITAEQMLNWMKQTFPDVALPKPSPTTPAAVIEMTVKNPVGLARDMTPPLEKVGRRNTLTALSATEAFVVWMMVALVMGLIVSSPMVLYELWSFVAEGLYPHEKKYVYFLLPISIGLFFFGVMICQFFIMPAALQALFSFNAWLQIDPDLRLREWLGFAIMMPVITGLCFQTPLVMLFLGKIGVFTAADFLSKWRVAIFILLIFAAIFSPSIDAVSLFILWVPMCALYFLGIFFVKMVEKQRDEEVHEETPVDEVPFDPDMMK